MTDISRLDLNLLKALDALLDECNVTRAATRLGVTQPAMSAMLARLRNTFNDPLFVRAQRGVVPTRRALALARPLKQVLSGVNALLLPSTFDPATARQTFNLAATDYAQRAIAVPFLAALRRQAPLMRVALVPVDDSQVQAQLERGSVDLALLTPDSAAPDLHARTLFAEHYVCVLREDHPAIDPARPVLSVEQLCALDHALVSYRGEGFRGVADQALERLGKQRQVSVSVSSFMVLPDILRSSDLIAIVPSRLLVGTAGLLTFEPPLAIPGFVKIAAWHERTHQDPAQRWLRELLFASCTG